MNRPAHLARKPLRAVVVPVTRHVWYCDCPSCPQRWTHRANRGTPIVQTVMTIQYVRTAR